MEGSKFCVQTWKHPAECEIVWKMLEREDVLEGNNQIALYNGMIKKYMDAEENEFMSL